MYVHSNNANIEYQPYVSQWLEPACDVEKKYIAIIICKEKKKKQKQKQKQKKKGKSTHTNNKWVEVYLY